MPALDGFEALRLITCLSPRRQYVLGCCVVGAFADAPPAVLTALLNAGLLDMPPQGELFAPYTVPTAVAHAYRVWARDRLSA